MAKYLTVKQFCERYAISRSSFYRLRERGMIKPAYIGRSIRISLAEIDKFDAMLADKGNPMS